MAEKFTVTIRLTEEEEESIKAFFNHNDWEYDRVQVADFGCQVGESKVPKKKRKLEIPTTSDSGYSGLSDNGDGGDQEPDPGPLPDPLPLDDGECQHCYLTPCVAKRNFVWLGNGQEVCHENSGLRHGKFTKFWHVINNLGGWTDPRYLRKEARWAGGEWALQHRREIMPLCVLWKVRQLFPNLPGVHYMGHKWQ